MRILPFLLYAIKHDVAAGHKRYGVADAGGFQPNRTAGQAAVSRSPVLTRWAQIPQIDGCARCCSRWQQ